METKSYDSGVKILPLLLLIIHGVCKDKVEITEDFYSQNL